MRDRTDTSDWGKKPQRRGSNRPVLVLETLAALSGRDDRIRSFEVGADNYLAWPAEADEMLVNVKALPRPQSTQADLAKSATIANPKRAPG